MLKYGKKKENIKHTIAHTKLNMSKLYQFMSNYFVLLLIYCKLPPTKHKYRFLTIHDYFSPVVM